MRLEVDEVVVSEDATTADLEKVDFTTPVALLRDDEHYFQWFIDDPDDPVMLCRRSGEWSTYEVCEIESFPIDQMRELFGKYLAGDQSGLEQFPWEPGDLPGDPGVITLQWEHYPAQTEDGGPVWIMYNEGIAANIDTFEYTQVVRYKLTCLVPDEDGFPSEAERDTIDKIVDDIEEFTDQVEGLFVGHMTFEGECYFYAYADIEEATVKRFVKKVATERGYELEFQIEPDDDFSCYWEVLYPDPISRQLIFDMRLFEIMEEEGDDLSEERTIVHFAAFPTSEILSTFQAWAMEQKFAVEATAEPDDANDEFRIEFSRVDAPNVTSLTPVTCELLGKCLELGGAYDGWDLLVTA